MSEEKQIVIKFELPQVVNKALNPLAQSIGETLAHGWNGMTMGIETWLGKKTIDHNLNLQLYKDAIQSNISKVDEDNLQEPSINILGPSLDASKYFFEEDQYRHMFSKLIASSCDQSKNQIVHPAFVEFIKQMTPLEGKILASLNIDKPKIINVVKNINNNKNHYAYCPAIPNLFGASPLELNVALSNLERLGFISMPHGFSLVSDDSRFFQETDEFHKIKLQIEEHISFHADYHVIAIEMTALGKNFIKVCIK